MNVLMISPGFPVEQPFFTRGLAEVGANVIGLGDQHQGALSEVARSSLSAYVQVPSLGDEQALLAESRKIADRVRIDRVECLFEMSMVAAARVREMLGLSGMTVAETIPFRDKEIMKQRLDAAGIRTPRHGNAYTGDQVREHAEWIGYPLVVKPIDGAGSQDTYRIDSAAELEKVIPALVNIKEVSVEEFVEGEDFTFDTVCIDGEIAYSNIAYYRPRALVARNHRWISQQTLCRRDVESDEMAPGREMGEAVLKALDFRTGFTHMEWFRTESGEAVFGEIAARAPGVRTVDLMNFAGDIDLYQGWAEAICHGQFSQQVERKYWSAGVCKRANGEGIIRRVDGLDRIYAEFGPHLCAVNLTPVGSPMKNWRMSTLADGFIVVRHPDHETVRMIADRVATDVQLHATP